MGFAAHSALALLMIASSTCVASAPPRAQIDPHIVHLGVTDGDDLRFVRLSRSQGLSQQRVTHIVQDERGFLWFGTQYGLNRYDGYRFRVFKNDPTDPDSLCDVHITALFKTAPGGSGSDAPIQSTATIRSLKSSCTIDSSPRTLPTPVAMYGTSVRTGKAVCGCPPAMDCIASIRKPAPCSASRTTH